MSGTAELAALVALDLRLASLVNKRATLSGVSDRGWMTLYQGSGEWQMGAWQQDSELTTENTLAFSPVYACLTLASSDVGKICLDLMTQEKSIWVKTESPSFSPLLRKPNHYQTRQQFIETWVLSKLRRGNTYVLKMRDARSVVKQMYVLDPDRVTPLVAPDGAVFYELRQDDLSKLPVDRPAIPASEIIHDRMECLFHPLVGISPLFAAYLATSQGLRIQRHSDVFFKNLSRPGGMLTAPAAIDDETAARLKDEFEKNFSNEKIGRLFVGGDGLTYNPIAHTAEESQLTEQLNMSGLQVCSAFHIPPYMVGIGPQPTTNESEPLIQRYYSQCLQKLFNAIEDLLDEGLGLYPLGYRTEFDLRDLTRMDRGRQVEILTKASGGAYMTPNEARAEDGRLPKPGGDSLYKQHQDYSLEALARRDALDNPFAPENPAPKPESGDEVDAEEQAKFWRDIADLPMVAEGYAKSLPLLEAR